MNQNRKRDVSIATSAEDMEELRAGECHFFGVGINAYENGFDKLKTAVKDVEAVAGALKEWFGFHAENMVVLRNQEAIRAAIVQELKKKVRELKENDSLIIYYAGHGLLDEDIGYWIPVDGKRGQDASWIGNSEIQDILRGKGCKARHVLLVSDSCFAESLLRRAEAEDTLKAAPDVLFAYRKRSRQVMTGGANEPVADGGGIDHSIFAHFFLEQLTGSHRPFLMPAEMYPEIRKGVSANARQHPLFGNLKDALIEPGGELVLFRHGGLAGLVAMVKETKQKQQAISKQAQAAEEKFAIALAQKQAELRRVEEELRHQDDVRLARSKHQSQIMEELDQAMRQKKRQAREQEKADRQAREAFARISSYATKENPFENSLGMKFVPVPNTQVLFCIWETRVKDYEAYAKAKPGINNAWRKPGFDQDGNHPVVNVNWGDGRRFCQWLTEKERKEGRIRTRQKYRLPTDEEWSWAVGLPRETGESANEKCLMIRDHYPWGSQWPPPKGAGNYADETLKKKCTGMSVIEGYDDGYAETSPVGSFTPNRHGLYDMGGNVGEWCQDWFDQEQECRVLRGASWLFGQPVFLLSSLRLSSPPDGRSKHVGFRCVLAVRSSPGVGGSS